MSGICGAAILPSLTGGDTAVDGRDGVDGADGLGIATTARMKTQHTHAL